MADLDVSLPYGRISSPEQLGTVVRKKRREIGINQADVAGLVGVGVRFLSELERGKATVELGKVLKVLSRIGLEVWIVPRGLGPGGP